MVDESSVGTFCQIVRGQTLQVNSQDQIVQSENYCYSSLRVASNDEVKIQPLKDYHVLISHLKSVIFKETS